MTADKQQQKRWLLLLMLFLVGAAISFFVANKTHTEKQAALLNQAEYIGREIQLKVQEAIDLATNDIRNMRAFYNSSEYISEEEFQNFTEVLYSNREGHIYALSWVPVVPHALRAEHEAWIQKDYPSYEITARSKEGKLKTRDTAAYYYPVARIMPYRINQAAHGFDLNSNETRRAALNTSRDSNQITATARIKLVQETGDSYGFLMFAPIYQLNTPLSNAAERQQAHLGFISGVFRIDSLLKTTESIVNQSKLKLTLVDLTSGNTDLLSGSLDNPHDFSYPLNLPQRQLSIRIALPDSLRAELNYSQPALLVFVGGIVLTLLICALVNALMLKHISEQINVGLLEKIRSDKEALASVVEERTHDLNTKNQMLKNTIEELNSNKELLLSLMAEAQESKNIAIQQSKDLLRSNKDLDDFAYVASHDLKAPLRGIDQLASWVAEDIEAGQFDDVSNHLHMIRKRVQRLENLLNDLLSYSRIGRTETSIALVNSYQSVQELFELMSPPKEFKLHASSTLPSFTTAVAPFEKVIRNLLNNAVKHNDKENGEIWIDAEEQASQYLFVVRDNGPGIDEKFHDQVFQMFSTLKPRDEVEGSGMGLAMIKKTTEFYGGTISVSSQLGKGSTFSFTWPKQIKD